MSAGPSHNSYTGAATSCSSALVHNKASNPQPCSSSSAAHTLGALVMGMVGVVSVTVGTYAQALPLPETENTGGVLYTPDFGEDCRPDLSDYAYGGACAQSGADSASNATVEILDNSPNVDVFGGYVSGSLSLQASGNKVTLQPGSAAKNVYGGYAQTGDASDNTVILSGSATVTGAVYGGYAASGGDALNNRVIIQGNPNLTGSMLYGGSSTGAGLSAGNVLEIHSTGLTAQNVSAFQEIHFILPANTAANTTVLTLNGGVTPQATNLRGVKVGVGIKAGGNVLQNGDRVTLIHNAQGIDTDATIAQADVSGYQGVSLKYTFGLSADATNVYATAKTDAVVMEQTKAPVEGQASMMALSVQGGDLAAGAGIARAMGATSGVSGTSAFGASGGGSSRYKSGSHVDVDGFSVMLGAAKRFSRNTGQLLAGAFVEGGWGHYDTYNEFSSGVVRGGGKSRYVGAGVLLRRDWGAVDAQGRSQALAGTGPGAPYVEGSLRLGRVSSNWSSNEMQGSADASYDTSALYYGAHVGVGYVLPLWQRNSLDISAKYFWTHQQGDKVTIAADPYHFQSVDSHRSRLGARFNHQFTEHVAPGIWARPGSANSTAQPVPPSMAWKRLRPA